MQDLLLASLSFVQHLSYALVFAFSAGPSHLTAGVRQRRVAVKKLAVEKTQSGRRVTVAVRSVPVVAVLCNIVDDAVPAELCLAPPAAPPKWGVTDGGCRLPGPAGRICVEFWILCFVIVTAVFF